MKMNQQKSSEAAVMTSVVLKGERERFSHLKMSRDSLTFGNVSATQICTTDTRRVVLVKTSDTKAFM